MPSIKLSFTQILSITYKDQQTTLLPKQFLLLFIWLNLSTAFHFLYNPAIPTISKTAVLEDSKCGCFLMFSLLAQRLSVFDYKYEFMCFFIPMIPEIKNQRQRLNSKLYNLIIHFSTPFQIPITIFTVIFSTPFTQNWVSIALCIFLIF